jgi:phage terminase large subunit
VKTTSETERVRFLGQWDLGAAIEVGTGEELWSTQREIATLVSQFRAKVAVPSCNASGKTWLAARLAIAFYNAFTPGTPCVQCDPDGTRGGCRGSKVITTSSKESHLKDNLWGEIRAAIPKLRDRNVIIPGHIWEADMRLENIPGAHFIIGQSASSAEGMQGYHAAHKLIIGDEATSVDEDVQLAITRLLASSDSRILLIYNPTTPDTYASRMAHSGSFETVTIDAYSTPHFTKEHIPEGSNLISQNFLDDLVKQGTGPGSFEWVTSVLAQDWDLGDDVLVPAGWYERARIPSPVLGTGQRQLGIDIASYGSDENIIGFRDGIQLVEMRPFHAMQTSMFVQGPVTAAVLDFDPDVLVFDGDGVGAGAVGYFEDLAAIMKPEAQIIGFRGAKSVNQRYLNQRSAQYWMLRRRFESQTAKIAINDPVLFEQLTTIHYTVTQTGDVRVESKQEMRKRSKKSPDRADGLMYTFAYADLLLPPATGPADRAERTFGVQANTDEAMWDRLKTRLGSVQRPVNPVTGVSDDW